MSQRFDVMVIGAGPAGCAAALTLARNGASVLVIDRSGERPAVGEGLPPVAASMLRDLGLWERFLSDEHLPSYGNRSVWGLPYPEDHDFLLHPEGVGWHLDRDRFDRMLRAAAADAGSICLDHTRVMGCRRERDGWHLALASGGVTAFGGDTGLSRQSGPPASRLTQTPCKQREDVTRSSLPTNRQSNSVADRCRQDVRADYLVDASGRSRALARSQGANVLAYDRLTGVVAVMQPGEPVVDSDSLTLVEATENGWWYATLLPVGRLVVGYVTDSDIARANGARTPDGWQALLQQTTYIRERVAGCGYGLEGQPRVVSAESSQLDVPWGEGWCAVGDAAAAHDPLSSQGITSALTAGARAAQAVGVGSSDSMEEYGEWVRERYGRYLANWLAYYDLERRWPDSPFWARRHALLDELMRR